MLVSVGPTVPLTERLLFDASLLFVRDERFAAGGRPYYVDNNNHATQWDHPAPLPRRWTRHPEDSFSSEGGTSPVKFDRIFVVPLNAAVGFARERAHGRFRFLPCRRVRVRV